MIGSKGQQWAVMKLLQGAVISLLILTIAYGVVQTVRDKTPSSDVYSVTCRVLGSAYAARGTGEFFVREALLVEDEFDSESLVRCSGLPDGTRIDLICKKGFCLKDGEPLNRGSECRKHSPCFSMEFVGGDTIPICILCEEDKCMVWFGESEC